MLPRSASLRTATFLFLGTALFGGLPGAQGNRRPATGGTPPTAPGVVVDTTQMAVTPTTLDFGPLASGSDLTLGLTLRNDGSSPVAVQRVVFELGSDGNSQAFSVLIGGQTVSGSTGSVTRSLAPAVTLPPGGQPVPVQVTFEPTLEQYDSFTLRFEGGDDTAEVAVAGLGGHEGDPYLHVVLQGPDFLVDYDENGSEVAFFDGTTSHTHEPGHSLSGYVWTVDGMVASTTTTLSTVLSMGTTDVELDILDDNVPPRSLEDSKLVAVVAKTEVPGILAEYYEATATGPEALLDAVPEQPDFVEQVPGLHVAGLGKVGNSPFTGSVMVRLTGTLLISQTGLYEFVTQGGTDSRLLVEGFPMTAPTILFPGVYAIEARFAVQSLSDQPLDVLIDDGSGATAIDPLLLAHDETDVSPVMHDMTPSGLTAGGTPITIDGFGFFPAASVKVHWGGTVLQQANFTSLSPTRIQFLSPAGGGAIAVQVESANGTSNVKTYLYQLTGPPPIVFELAQTLIISEPTAGTWGSNGHLYVTSLTGQITEIVFGDDYSVVSTTTHAGISGLSNPNALSVVTNPYDPPSPVRLYVGHGDHFVNGGTTPTGPSPYTGQVSLLEGPNFDTPVPVVTGLPVSNHDHAINGMAFDNNGDLLISVGSMTNAGVKDPDHGDLPESPLSAAVVKARLSKPGFNGAITYVETAGGAPNDDQRFGDVVDVAPGVDVELHAAGLRNAFGMVFTTKSRLYVTDNGPNFTFGPASLTASTQGPDPYDDDELNLIEWGNYYGSPNRNRGRTDDRQNTYRAGLAGPQSIADNFTQMVGWMPPSTDGIDEFRSDVFEGQLRGQMILQRYIDKMRRATLRSDGRLVVAGFVINPSTLGLGCLVGPNGALISFVFEESKVKVLVPDDLSDLELVINDVFPWRAPATGGTPFVLRGRGFGTLANTSVTIGGVPATLTAVTWDRVDGLTPVVGSPTTALQDIAVTVGSDSDTLPQAFRFLLGPGLEPGRWEALASVSTPLGEVAAGTIDGILYLVGEGNHATFAYDLLNRQWQSVKAQRPFPGSHHAAEVIAGKLYLIGGFDNGAEGKVQIYDPVGNFWSTGTPMPWSAGSVATALIDGKIYVAGGVVGTSTVNNCAVYDPDLDSWTSLAAMPDSGRNHATAGTNGSKLFVFGGRRAGNWPTNGYNSTMVYDPMTNTWAWSGDGVSGLAPLPEARGGMGKAVWYRGEFYVFGGETLDDPDANGNGVYDRVDVYNPTTNIWRAEAKMPNPRHGTFPVLFQGWMFLAGGGTASGNSQSMLFDAFTRQ